MSTIVYDIEVVFYPEVTRMAEERGVDEKRLSWKLDANLRYVSHISYKIDKAPVVDMSILDYPGGHFETAEYSLLRDFAAVYNACDESVAHYGSKFDIRFLRSRYARANLPPLKPIKTHDTWRVLKDRFLITDNRLASALKFFKAPTQKMELPWRVWQAASRGDVKALTVMRSRCHSDTAGLAWLFYNHLRNHTNGTVNRALAYDKTTIDDAAIYGRLKKQRCPTCAGVGKLKREGFLYTKIAVKVQMSCRACFAWVSAPLEEDGALGVVR